MITLSEDVLEALTGSREGEKIEASAWYGGRLVAQDIIASSWSMTDDATRQVRRELSLQIEDPAGDLIPVGYDAPLSACGRSQRRPGQYPSAARTASSSARARRSRSLLRT